MQVARHKQAESLQFDMYLPFQKRSSCDRHKGLEKLPPGDSHVAVCVALQRSCCFQAETQYSELVSRFCCGWPQQCGNSTLVPGEFPG